MGGCVLVYVCACVRDISHSTTKTPVPHTFIACQIFANISNLMDLGVFFGERGFESLAFAKF